MFDAECPDAVSGPSRASPDLEFEGCSFAARVLTSLNGVSLQPPHEASSLALPEHASAEFLHGLGQQERARHAQIAHELSYGEYLQRVFAAPHLFIRNAGQYTVDAMESYGFGPRRVLGRWILDFELRCWPWQSESVGERRELVGQELPTFRFYEANKIFARRAHPDRMLIFHGPPGSGKTLLSETIDAMLEDYSRNNPDGALYRLIWVFDERHFSRMGFPLKTVDVEEQEDENDKSRRFLVRPEGCTDPIFLISKDPSLTAGRRDGRSAREELYERLAQRGLKADFNRDYLLSGGLDSTSERILEALSDYYRGDLGKIIRNHVRVERWTMSAKLGRGLASIRPNPDHHADAELLYPRYGVDFLPPELAGAERELFAVRGMVLNANRGHLHFADLLRPNERDRSSDDLSRLAHLLETIEGGSAQVLSMRDPGTIRTESINTLVRADTNDEHIEQKRQGSGWRSFRQRCTFITAGIITRFKEEARAHEPRLRGLLGAREAAPHALDALALFVTATRLLKPDAAHYRKIHEELPGAIKNMSVAEKALLLQEPAPGAERESLNILRAPDSAWKAAQLQLLERHTDDVADEYMHGVGDTRFSLYDGGMGISTRAAQDLLREMVMLRPEQPFTVLEVLQVLESRLEGGFEYYQEVAAAKTYIREQMITQRKEDAASRGKSLADSDIKKITSEILAQVERLYPVPEPAGILQEVKLYARRKIEDDIYRALGVASADESRFALMRYVEHARVFSNPGGGEVNEAHRVSRLDSGRSANEGILREFEDQIVTDRAFESAEQRAEFRKEILSRVGAWKLDNPGKSVAENLEQIFPKVVSDMRSAERAALKRRLAGFLKSTTTYALDQQQREKDRTGDREQRRKLDDWERAISRLRELGYPEQSIAAHVLWAIGSDKES